MGTILETWNPNHLEDKFDQFKVSLHWARALELYSKSDCCPHLTTWKKNATHILAGLLSDKKLQKALIGKYVYVFKNTETPF